MPKPIPNHLTEQQQLEEDFEAMRDALHDEWENHALRSESFPTVTTEHPVWIMPYHYMRHVDVGIKKLADIVQKMEPHRQSDKRFLLPIAARNVEWARFVIHTSHSTHVKPLGEILDDLENRIRILTKNGRRVNGIANALDMTKQELINHGGRMWKREKIAKGTAIYAMLHDTAGGERRVFVHKNGLILTGDPGMKALVDDKGKPIITLDLPHRRSRKKREDAYGVHDIEDDQFYYYCADNRKRRAPKPRQQPQQIQQPPAQSMPDVHNHDINKPDTWI